MISELLIKFYGDTIRRLWRINQLTFYLFSDNNFWPNKYVTFAKHLNLSFLNNIFINFKRKLTQTDKKQVTD